MRFDQLHGDRNRLVRFSDLSLTALKRLLIRASSRVKGVLPTALVRHLFIFHQGSEILC